MGRQIRRVVLTVAAPIVLALALPALAQAAQGDITTVAGTTQGLSGDGGPATAAQLNTPFGVAPTPDGGFLIADAGNNRIRRVSATGTITTVAGTSFGLSGDGGPAIAAKLDDPSGVAPTADGGFLIADADNNRIRRVSATGTITTVAGTSSGLSGDGGPATAAQLSFPSGVAPTPDGGYLIADQDNHRIRKVSATGTITTVAGTSFGLSGDGGPAIAAQLNTPFGVAPTPDGGFLIADADNNRIRRVSATGTITTVAGTSSGLSGDGGPATAAQLSFPSGVAPTPDGGYLIADQDNHRIRKVSATGTITTVAGTTQGLSGDGGPATAAQLAYPYGVAPTPDGGFLIADADNHRIRKVEGAPAPAACGAGKFFVILGTAADDSQTGTVLRDAIVGLADQDTQRGLGAKDCLSGGDGTDTQSGGGGKDLLLGGSGPDSLSGGPATDKLKGQAGNDQLDGGGGGDTLTGGGGTDFLDGGPGADALKCGGGLDIARRGPGDTVSPSCEFVKRQ